MPMTHAAKPARAVPRAKPGPARTCVARAPGLERLRINAGAADAGSGPAWSIADIPHFAAPANVLPPHDPHETAAEQAAQAALRTPVRSADAAPGSASGGATAHPPLAPARLDAAAAPAHVARVMAAGGMPLDPATRADFEPRFGRDFSAIRVHADTEAASSARALGARAYAAGHHLVFARGEYAPGTAAGSRLLAHELAHTTQALPRIARQEDPDVPRGRTGKQEGAGETIKPVTLKGDGPNAKTYTYAYAIWGQWQASDTLETFRDRVLPKWVHWRFAGISAPEAKNLVAYLKEQNLIRLNVGSLQVGYFYAIPIENAVMAEARRVSGEIDREEDARKKQKAAAAGGEATGKPPADKGADKDAAGGDGSPEGERTVAVTGDPGALAGNAALATLYLDMLARYAGLAVDRKRAEHGLTREEVAEITKGSDAARDMTAVFTQGWREYGAAGGADIARFGFMEEALLTQRARGNFTAQHNQLAYGKDPEGLGLYKRGTLFRYYDENGAPVMKIGGGYRDPGYRSMVPPKAALAIPITDRGLLSVLSSIKNVTLDDQVQIYAAAKGFWDNQDLLWPAVRDGWDGYGAVEAELRRQMPVLVVFLGLHGIAITLQKFNDPKAKAVGVVLEYMLKAAGKVFQITFIGEMLELLYSSGLELSKIERKPGEALDSLSQAHLTQAALSMRQLLAAAIAAGLTAAMVEVSRQTAITIGNIKPPGGGLQPAPATVGAPGSLARPGAAAAAGPPTGLARPPIGVPIAPQNLETRGSGSSGEKKPKAPADVKDPEAKPAAGKAEEGAGEKPEKTPKEVLQAAKDRKLGEITEKQILLETIYAEIAEAVEEGKQRLSDAERTTLRQKLDGLAREANLEGAEKDRLLRQFDNLSISPYERARAYSMSEQARKAVIDRAKARDELSNKPADVTVDHIVPVNEIVEMEGWNELTWEQQKEILSDPDNLIGMDRGPNSSKSDLRWSEWKNGRRIYGDVVADRMIAREAQLRRMLQGKIKARKATR